MEKDAPADNVLTTRTQRITLRPDGVILTQNLNSEEQSATDARANIDASARVSGGVRRPLLVDTTIPAPLSKEAQDFYTSADAAKVVTAVAIIVKNWVGRLIGNFVIGRRHRDVPMRLFENQAEALKWLKDYPPTK